MRPTLRFRLSGKEAEIQILIDRNISKSAIAQKLGVHRHTVAKFVKEKSRITRKIN